jgi:hypothetical protein
MSRPETPEPDPRQCTTPATCRIHGAQRFCNVRLRKIGGEIEIDPHVDGSCVVRFDEDAATALYTLFGEWLGWPTAADLLAA